MPQSAIHTFDNGVRLYDHHLLDVQRVRYRRRNVHEEDEEEVFLGALAAIPPGGTFVNVGSAVGYYLFLARLKRPDVSIHAVEPLPSHVEKFRENISINSFPPANFGLHEVAVSASNETEASLLDDAYGSRLLRPGEAPPPKSVRVKAMTLRQLCHAVGAPVDLLQMDIQGLELPVLRSFFAEDRTVEVATFLIGTHGLEIHRQVMTLLKNSGYTIAFECAQPANQPDGILLANRKR